MAFVAPLWLWGLIPWAALAAWVITGRHQIRAVPFVALWRGTAPKRAVRPRVERPPWAVIFALLALLLAVLGAAKPTGKLRRARITLIVDRGLTMSAGREPRFVASAQRLIEHTDAESIEIVDAINGTRLQTRERDLVSTIRSMKRTAIDARPLVIEAVREALLESDGEVILLTDRALPWMDQRLLVIAPPQPLRSAGIIRMAARGTQVMVTVRSSGISGKATLTVQSGQTKSTKIFESADGDQNLFVDFPVLSHPIKAIFSDGAEDEIANHDAFLALTGESPRIEVRSTAVGQALQKMVEVYGRNRPATGGVIALVNDQDELKNENGAVIAPPGGMTTRGKVKVTTDPLTSVVDWQAATEGTHIASTGPRGEGWQTLVAAESGVLVARRESPARQVWVGFDQTKFAKTVDFVVFWTNVFQWLGGDGQQWETDTVRRLPVEWRPRDEPPKDAERNLWPGLYLNASGKNMAMNAPPVDFESLRSETGLVRLVARGEKSTWSSPLLWAAFFCGALGLALWPRG